MRNAAILLASLLLLASCFNERDYDIQQVSLTPSVAFPVAFGNMSLVEMLANKDTAFIRSYPDGLLYLQYEHMLASEDIRNQFVLPDNNSTVSFDLPPGTLPASSTNTVVGSINRQINLGLSPELLTEVLLKAGNATHALQLSKETTPANLPMETTITLLDVVHKTTMQPMVITMGNGSGVTSLSDYIIQLVDNQFSIRVDLLIKPHPATYIPVSTTADIHLGLVEMQFAYIKGFFGDQIIPLPPQSLDISVFQSSLKDASASFVQPSITLKAMNDYGVPVDVSFSTLQARKGSNTLPFQISPGSPVTLQSPATLGASATTNITVTNDENLLGFGPEVLEYTASARINRALVSGSNFMADTSQLRISLVTEIPLFGRVTGIVVTDTLSVDLAGVKQTEILESSLKVTAQNEMPLNAFIQIYLLDSAYQVMDSVFATNQTYLVKASTVDVAGDLEHTGVTNLTVPLDANRLTRLFSSSHLLVRSEMSTARDQNNALLNVKFRSSYRLNLNIGLLAKLNVLVK